MEKSIFGNTPSDIQQFDQQLLAINKATAEFAKVKTVEDLNRINAKLAAVSYPVEGLESSANVAEQAKAATPSEPAAEAKKK